MEKDLELIERELESFATTNNWEYEKELNIWGVKYNYTFTYNEVHKVTIDEVMLENASVEFVKGLVEKKMDSLLMHYN